MEHQQTFFDTSRHSLDVSLVTVLPGIHALIGCFLRLAENKIDLVKFLIEDGQLTLIIVIF